VTGFQREVKRKKRVIEYAEKNRNIKTACVDSSSLRPRDAHRQRSWLAKKNPNPRKINNLRSRDRHIAAPRTALNAGNGTPAALTESPSVSNQ